MRTVACGAVVWCAVLGAAVPAARAQVSFDVSPRIGAMSGDTSYEIGGYFAGPTPADSGYTMPRLSELKFPLDVSMVGIGGNLTYGFPYAGTGRKVGGALALEAEYAQSFTEDAGELEDSDWTEPSAPDMLTIYSTSDAKLDAKTWELRALLYPLQVKGSFVGARVGFGGGYLAQSFSYDVSNVSQWSIYPDYNGSYPGKVLTYDVDYEIPYVGIAAALTLGEGHTVAGSIDARLGYSAWVQATDRDDHLLRQKVSEGDAEGDAVLLSLRGRLTFVRHVFVTIGVSALSIDAEGTQTQTRYAANDEGPAGLIGTIDSKVTSDQVVVDFGVGVSF
jgi:hypothetical protein